MGNFNKKTITNASFCYLLIVVSFVVLRILSSCGVFNSIGKWGRLGINIFLQIGILFFISIFVFSLIQKHKLKSVFKFYGYEKISWKAVIYSIMIGIIVFILNIFIASFFSVLLSHLGYQRHSSSAGGGDYPVWLFFVNIAVTAILPAICEETVHRGMLLKTFAGKGITKAIVISSLLFGLTHLNIEQFFYASIIGFFLGYLTIISGSIFPAMIVHFMNNALNVSMSFSQAHGFNMGGIFGWVQYNFTHNPIVALLFVVMLFAVSFFLLKVLIHALFKETSYKKLGQLQSALLQELIRKNYFHGVGQIMSGDMHPTEFLRVSQDELNQMYMQKMSEMNNLSQIDMQMMSEDISRKPKLLNLSDVFLVLSFVITILVTISTFIWGLL